MNLKGMSRNERYSLFLYHMLGSKQQLIEEVASQETVGELLVLLSFLNAALVSQLSSDEVEEFGRMTLKFGQGYSELLEKAGVARDGRVAFVVPIIEGLDYSKTPAIKDYLTPEELSATISSKGNSQREANETTKTFLSTDVSKTIQ